MKMTDLSLLSKKERQEKNIKILISLIILTLSAFISVFLSPYITKYTNDGLRLCANTIIGSVFPFLILTDIFVAFARFDSIGCFRRLFEKIFKINGYAITAYAVGLICGFPLGVKVAVDLYKSGLISRDECERLIGFSNNTGPAFVIGGVGFGLRGSVKEGIILYFSMLIASAISGFIIGLGKKSTSVNNEYERNSIYDFISSVKNAATNTLNVCAFVVFFSVISGILSLVIKNEIAYSLAVSIAEVSNAAKVLARSSYPRKISLSLTSFAISFSGISVHMQAKCFTYGTEISMKRYYITKILQGTLSATVTFFLTLLFQI